MNRNVIRITAVAAAVLALGACGGSGKAKSTTSSTTKTTTTTVRPDPNAPKPVVGTNGVTVTYLHADSGTITPKVTNTSETTMPGEHGGALFRIAHTSGLAVWGAAEGDVYPLLNTRPGWTITKLNADPAWTPGACSSAPSAVVGDRFMVTAEGTNGLDEQAASKTGDNEFRAYYIRVFDRQRNTFSVITPITADAPTRWRGPLWSVSPTEVAVVGTKPATTEEPRGVPEIVRTINLETMAFRDAPYTKRPAATDVADAQAGQPGQVTVTSKTTGKTLTLTDVSNLNVTGLTAPTALVAYDNEKEMPSHVASQVGVWNMESGDWNRAFDSQRPADASTLPNRPAVHAQGFPGFGLWFAGFAQ